MSASLSGRRLPSAEAFHEVPVMVRLVSACDGKHCGGSASRPRGWPPPIFGTIGRAKCRGGRALVFFVVILLVGSGGRGSDAGSPATPVGKPTDIIYPGAGHAATATGPVPGMASVSYIVKEHHPTAVLEFYDRELAKLGYIPRVDPVFGGDTRKWIEFIDGTLPASPRVRQLGAFWIQPASGRHVRLVLRQYEFKDSAGNYRAAAGQEVVLQMYGPASP